MKSPIDVIGPTGVLGGRRSHVGVRLDATPGYRVIIAFNFRGDGAMMMRSILNDISSPTPRS